MSPNLKLNNLRLNLFRISVFIMVLSLIVISACNSKYEVDTVERDGLVYESSGRSSSDDFPADKDSAEGDASDSPFAKKASEREAQDKEDVPPPPSFG